MLASRVWSVFERVNILLHTIANFAGVFTAFFVAFLVSADVLGRYLFNKPITGTYEIVQSLLVIIAFFGFAYAQRYRRHIIVEMIASLFSPRLKLVLEIFAFGVGLIFFGILTIVTWDVAWDAWLTREWFPGALRLPSYPSKMAVSVGSMLMCLQLLTDLVNSIRALMMRKGA